MHLHHNIHYSNNSDIEPTRERGFLLSARLTDNRLITKTKTLWKREKPYCPFLNKCLKYNNVRLILLLFTC